MTESIKLRTAIRDGVLTVRMLIRHPMDVGGRRENGESIAPHYIKEITCRHNGEIAMQGHWGAGIAKNPYLAFTLSGAAAGDELTIEWVDNQGTMDELVATI